MACILHGTLGIMPEVHRLGNALAVKAHNVCNEKPGIIVLSCISRPFEIVHTVRLLHAQHNLIPSPAHSLYKRTRARTHTPVSHYKNRTEMCTTTHRVSHSLCD